MRTVTALLITAGVLAACTGTPAPGQTADRAPDRLRVEVLEVLPHDPEAFTQGLELHGDTLYEGTGLVGESAVRAGPPGAEPTVRADLPRPLFGEGITVVGSRLWQLTWKAGVALERDRETLAELRRVEYSGEGWGLCHQPEQDRLVMSDGSAELTFRDPRTFAGTGSVRVSSGGRPVPWLNELECVGDAVYANVWKSDRIMRIDPGSGEVTAEIDASGLLDPAERAEADVLNGIAAPAGTDQLLLTGKLWPKMFRVRLVASG
nr:glutaminyl-peptide cyclotransferase [Amycolatopsis aidingensis]